MTKITVIIASDTVLCQRQHSNRMFSRTSLQGSPKEKGNCCYVDSCMKNHSQTWVFPLSRLLGSPYLYQVTAPVTYHFELHPVFGV